MSRPAASPAAVFYEARSETLEGQLAVARVIINRAKSERFRPTLCGVVTQPGQFSFVRGGVIPQPDVDPSALEARCGDQPYRACNDGWDSAAEGALYFHARRVKTAWARHASGRDRQSRFLSLISKLLVIPA
jgi:spore germination cell wall hydrolase CwlJ-like protein